MGANTKIIKRRMKSVVNTKKITKAMEMVSAAKMRRAVEMTLKTRPYATLARELMEQLSHTEKSDIPLLVAKPVQKMLVILVTSNRGLCGSFNSNMFKKLSVLFKDVNGMARHRVSGADDILPTKDTKVTVDIIGIGKKSTWFAKKYRHGLISVYDSLSERPRLEDILPISSQAMSAFIDGTYQKVIVAYTDYRSSLVQEPKVRQVLPISEIDLEKMAAELTDVSQHAPHVLEDEALPASSHIVEQYMFEPDPMHILTTVLPRLVEVQIHQAILESTASEHSARMVAMKSATEAAGDMLQELRLSFNKARQNAITQEIAEIVGGAAALE